MIDIKEKFQELKNSEVKTLETATKFSSLL